MVACLLCILAPAFAAGGNNILSSTGFHMDGDVLSLDLGFRYIRDLDKGMSLSVDLHEYIPIFENGDMYSWNYESELNQDIILCMMKRFERSNMTARLGAGLDLYSFSGDMGESEYRAYKTQLGLCAAADLQVTLWDVFALCLNGDVSYFLAGFSKSKPYRGVSSSQFSWVNSLRFTASVGLGASF